MMKGVNVEVWQNKYVGVLLAAVLLLLSLFSGLYIYKVGLQEGKEASTSAQPMDGTNNIQNQIDNNGSKSAKNTVENQIENNAGKDVKNNITNNITNNVEVNVQGDGDVVNNISNNISNGVTNGNGGNGSGNGNGSNGGDNGNDNGGSGSELAWGIDTASAVTEELNMCVRENFGDPAVVGRYLGGKEGVSAGLTQAEAELIKSNNDEILLIHNRFDDATGSDKGVEEAEEAIQLAEEIGAPKGTALFADIEPTYPVDAAFIRGWYDTVSSSSYEPGIYGIFDGDRALTAAFNEAVSQNNAIVENTYLWTASPNVGITTKENAPEYNPQAPDGSKIIGWQYGIGAQACNIDTNLFNNEFVDVLW
ncbi:glycoside hydrolase domain-containing protein [Bacillus salacetis]|uniref:glycoside hydrolase domain-containing protein n=1 Tax=Bacillus salacetis TaxID=2315464 RepID=UPI003B9ECA8A